MIDKSYRSKFHLAALPLGVKVTLTAFLVLIGAGYLTALANIYLHHQEADLEPGLGPDDLIRVYHGLEKVVTSETRVEAQPEMLVRVSPGGDMRKYLEKGGEESIRTLIYWLENGALEADFTREGLVEPLDPSPQDVIAETCVRCHHAAGGEKSDVPYAENRDALPTYALVSVQAVAPAPTVDAASKTMYLPPMSVPELVQVTHVHIFSIPAFTLFVAALFFLTGVSGRLKGIVGPLPMLAICLDIGGWWLARPFEPATQMIAVGGALFGTTLAVQIVCVLGSLWLGRPPRDEATAGTA
jgi:hypothetical protein